jgi:hypothetical protein
MYTALVIGGDQLETFCKATVPCGRILEKVMMSVLNPTHRAGALIWGDYWL